VLLCLEHLHSLGIAHRHIDLDHVLCNSIKPNFRDSEYKLLGVEMPSSAVDGDMFLAPEVFLGVTGPKQDVFALGILVYKVVSNNYPIEEPETMASYRKSQVDELSSILSDGEKKDYFSLEQKEFLAKCLLRDPLKRPSAQELLGDPWVKQQISKRQAHL
jgi:serine/threonine protein kinase